MIGMQMAAITVCIKVKEDGKIYVGEESEPNETPSAPGTEAPENEVMEDANLALVASIEKALVVAKGLLQSAIDEGEGEPMPDDESDMQDPRAKQQAGYDLGKEKAQGMDQSTLQSKLASLGGGMRPGKMM